MKSSSSSVRTASLLDRVDLAPLRAATDESSPLSTVLACLLSTGLLQHDPEEPAWPDRDRIVALTSRAAEAAGRATRQAGYAGDQGFVAALGGSGLAYAVGLALGSAAQGGIFRVWCLLDERVLDHGSAWEAAVTAGERRAEMLSAVVLVGGVENAPVAGRAALVFGGMGWHVEHARADDPAELLGAMDHLLRPGRGPGALLARVATEHS